VSDKQKANNVGQGDRVHPDGVEKEQATRLPIGTRIQFVKTLREGPTDETPAFLFAEKGEYGEVTGHNMTEGHWVKTDSWPTPFGAKLGEEFVVVESGN